MKIRNKSHTSHVKSYTSFKNGFTLIELLIVIAIIGILSSVVMVSTKGSVDKSKKTSALTTASSALPEIVTCADDAGNINAQGSTGGNQICTATGHSVKWASLGTTGWTYSVAATTNANIPNMVYRLVPPAGQLGILCDYGANTCCDDNVVGAVGNKASCD